MTTTMTKTDALTKLFAEFYGEQSFSLLFTALAKTEEMAREMARVGDTPTSMQALGERLARFAVRCDNLFAAQFTTLARSYDERDDRFLTLLAVLMPEAEALQYAIEHFDDARLDARISEVGARQAYAEWFATSDDDERDVLDSRVIDR